MKIGTCFLLDSRMDFQCQSVLDQCICFSFVILYFQNNILLILIMSKIYDIARVMQALDSGKQNVGSAIIRELKKV